MHHKMLSFSVSSSDLWANIMGHWDERSMLYIANEILLTLDMATASVAKSLLRSVHRPAVSREFIRKAMYWNEALSDSIVRKYNIKLRLDIYCCVISTGSYHQCPRWAWTREHQRFHWLSLILFRKFSINTKEITPKVQLWGSDPLSWAQPASTGWPVGGNSHLKKTLQHLPHRSHRPILQEPLATPAPQAHCPWSTAKLCRCSRTLHKRSKKFKAAGKLWIHSGTKTAVVFT